MTQTNLTEGTVFPLHMKLEIICLLHDLRRRYCHKMHISITLWTFDHRLLQHLRSSDNIHFRFVCSDART